MPDRSGDTLDAEGFIHCWRLHQLARVANAFFRGRDDLMLSEIDEEHVRPEVRDEEAPGGRRFPPLHGPPNVDAVRAVLPFAPGEDGTFGLPAELEVR